VLAQELGLNKSTVRSCLIRLSERGKILHTKRGYYRARLEGDKIPHWLHGDIQLHGLKIQANMPKIDGATTGHALVAIQPTSQENGRKTYSREFDGRHLTISIHDCGLVEIFNQCSKQPLGFLDFNRFTSYVRGIFPYFDVMGPELIQVGVNLDLLRTRMEGIKAISVQAFENAWISLYQKPGRGLRTEAHINLKSISLKEALDLIGSLLQGASQ
jgi:hypothetical protein